MRVDIKTSGFEQTAGLREHVLRRLRFALDWARDQVDRVTVQLIDVNGPRGGADKRCQVRIPLPRHREIVIADTEADLYAAIDRAVDRASLTLERRLRRQRVTAIKQARKTAREIDVGLLASAY